MMWGFLSLGPLFLDRIRRYLPPAALNALLTCQQAYLHAIRPYRTKELATRIFGRENARSRDLIEIDITYACNLRCAGCNRSCAQAPTVEMMTLAEIKKFLQESVEKGYRWKLIRIVGGEPTLHPKIHQIMETLVDYKNGYSPDTRIMLATNGFAEVTKEVIAVAPPEIEIDNSRKAPKKENYFVRFNMAPIDDPVFKDAVFTNGCRILKTCGIGLTPYGYYPCAVAGSIDRVLGFDLGRKELPARDDDMLDQLNVLCRYCGHFKHEKLRVIDHIYSPAWTKAYKEYSKAKKILKRYDAQ
jgi:hypothetical protein